MVLMRLFGPVAPPPGGGAELNLEYGVGDQLIDAIRSSTDTAAGHELTDLELIETPDPSPHLARPGVQHPFARTGCYCAVRMTNASVFSS